MKNFALLFLSLFLLGNLRALDSVSIQPAADNGTATISITLDTTKEKAQVLAQRANGVDEAENQRQYRAAVLARCADSLRISGQTATMTTAQIDAEVTKQKSILDAQAIQFKALIPVVK